MSKFVRNLIELFVMIIEMKPAHLKGEDVERILGKQPVLMKVLGEQSHRATPPGISEEHYCLDCASKHLSTAKILIREALQRAEKGEPPELVLAKIRGAYEELTGAEDDTQALSDEGIRRLNSQIRDLRKWFFDSGVLVETDKSKISEAFSRVASLNDTVYSELEKRKAKLKEFLGKVEERIQEIKEKLQTEKV